MMVDRSPPQYMLRALSYSSFYVKIIGYYLLPCVTIALNNTFPNMTMLLARQLLKDLMDPHQTLHKN